MFFVRVLRAPLPGGDWQRRGFRGGSSGVTGKILDEGNLAATYSALAALVALGADLAVDVDGHALVRALGSLQQEDGRLGRVFIPGNFGGGSFITLRTGSHIILLYAHHCLLSQRISTPSFCC